MSLTALLPQPRHSYAVRDEEDAAGGDDTARAPAAAAKPKFQPPPYGKRAGFVPRTLEDFGDGGAFPEIHVQQFPLNMGRKEKRGGGGGGGGAGAAGASSSSTAVVPLSVDASGQVQFDAIVKRGHDSSVVVHSGYQAMVAKNERLLDLSRPSAEDEERIAAETRAALGQIVDRKIATAMPTHVAKHSKEAVFIKYTPAEQNAAFNSGAQQRVIRLQEMPVDPLQPPKHKHTKLPPGPPDAPVPVMHSPPRKITKEDQEAWRIPPCISNWKNIKGYTIPLHQRLAADGRGLQEVQINDKFAKLSESLFVAERTARTEIEQRAILNKKMQRKLKEQKEEEYRNLATSVYQQATAGGDAAARETDDYTGGAAAADDAARGEGQPSGSLGGLAGYESDGDEAGREAREAIRRDRQRELKRDMRLEQKRIEKGTSSAFREQERDVSERIALGQAAPVNKESMFDARLFNQDAGLASGFGADDAYDVYSKPLFAQGSSAGAIYRPKAMADDDEGGAAAAAASSASRDPMDTSRFKADRGFAGTEHGLPGGGARAKPVEFERDAADADDPYGLGHLLSGSAGAESRRPSALDKIGQNGPPMGLGRETQAGEQRSMQFKEGGTFSSTSAHGSSSRRDDDRGRSRHSRSRSPRRRSRSRSRSRDRRR